MNWWQYYIGHCLATGWREIGNNFKMWADLMTGNYENYALLSDDDPYQECYDWFWYGINADETYPKEFLEYLQELCDRIDRGEEKLIPMDDVTNFKELFAGNYEGPLYAPHPDIKRDETDSI